MYVCLCECAYLKIGINCIRSSIENGFSWSMSLYVSKYEWFLIESRFDVLYRALKWFWFYLTNGSKTKKIYKIGIRFMMYIVLCCAERVITNFCCTGKERVKQRSKRRKWKKVRKVKHLVMTVLLFSAQHHKELTERSRN